MVGGVCAWAESRVMAVAAVAAEAPATSSHSSAVPISRQHHTLTSVADDQRLAPTVCCIRAVT